MSNSRFGGGQSGLDVRFVVNTIAPYLLTQRLLPLMDASGRVINLFSAAQAPVDIIQHPLEWFPHLHSVVA